MITADALGAVWPEVSHRLAKLLTSRGAAADVVDDVVQEVAARVLARRIAFTDAMDLMRWAVPVALNLLVDDARAAARMAVGPLEEHDHVTGDVADLVVHRDRLHRTVRAVGALSAGDRAALGTADRPADRREAVKLAVRRHRARRRLLALVDGVAGVLVWVAAALRRSRGSAATATVALAAVPVALLVGVAPAPRDAAPVPPPAASPAVRRPVRVAPAPVADAPARRAARTRVAAARPAPPVAAAGRAPGRTPRRVVRVGEPSTLRATVEEREPEPDDGLVCLRALHPLADRCVLQKDSSDGR